MNYYKTSDLQLAATLYALGYQLLALDKADPRRAMFLFDSTDELEQSTSDFYADRLSLNPRRLLSSFRLVKERLYGEA